MMIFLSFLSKLLTLFVELGLLAYHVNSVALKTNNENKAIDLKIFLNMRSFNHLLRSEYPTTLLIYSITYNTAFFY